MKKPLSVLVVGQTPPPVNGQSLMIQSFLEGQYDGLALHHVRMEFSRTMSEIGSMQIRKLWILLLTLLGIIRRRITSGATVLYYPPAGPTLAPVLRDFVLLIPSRWLFRKTAFHFHAAGLSNIYPQLAWWMKPLYWLAYRRPDLAIFTTTATSADGGKLSAKQIATVPCGIADAGAAYLAIAQRKSEPPELLFVGLLSEGKGLLILLQACSRLRHVGLAFSLRCVGAFDSAEFEGEVRRFVAGHGLDELVHFAGVLTGDEKARAYARASIFCFPSHYHNESFGVVLVEAMSFALPIVATRWRGTPEVVGDDGGALVVEPRDPAAFATALETLLRAPELRAAMGARNRQRYLERYTVEAYRSNLEGALLKVGHGE